MHDAEHDGKVGKLVKVRYMIDQVPTFPLAVIDFEASSLSLSDWPEISSYPIEVGIAIADADGTISTWSALIRPHPTWKSRGEWDRRSERVHRIGRDQLEAGLSAREAAEVLNERLAGVGTVWCDGGRYDAHWLVVLFATAGITPMFGLGDIAAALGVDAKTRERYNEMMEHRARRHRAGDDAADICTALSAAHVRG